MRQTQRVGSDLVHFGTAADPMDAVAIQGFLEANGVHCFVQGLHHNALLGGMGRFTIRLNLLTAEHQVDEAVELLQAFRYGVIEGEGQGDDDTLDDGDDWGEDSDEDEDEDEAEGEAEDAGLGSPRGRGQDGRALRTASVLSIVPSFGFGHFYSGAMVRGLVLCLIQWLGLALLFRGDLRGLVLIVSAVAVDFFGARERIHNLGPKRQPSRAGSADECDATD